MAGIPDMLTDIRTTGQGVPMGGQPPMGGPPPGQPPMGPPPGMGGGLASMGRGQPPMGPPPGMGGGQPPMGMEEPPMEEPMSIEKDAAMLAEATMGRTGGDPEAAAAILQTATQMIMSVGPQGDPMMGGEDPMMMNMGGPLYANMGRPIYAQNGTVISDLDTETLKQMIADSLLGKTLSDRDMGQSGRTLSDRDSSGRNLSDRDLAAYEAAAANGQTGRTISDKDLALHREMLNSGRNLSDRDFSSILKDLQEQEVFDSLISSRGGIPPKRQ
tara:strand:- start:286 stop:1101 length:816 start_codon:yes stop_codon:yes gene_type:complete